jgi:hypothetical protein
MDLLTVLWTILSFILGLLWSLAWFVLRDLISTLLWILIVAWLILSVRYRSFTSGTLALLRYGRYGLAVFWRWLRGTPGPVSSPIARADRAERVRARSRKPLGTMSISEQLNMLLVGAIYLLIFA